MAAGRHLEYLCPRNSCRSWQVHTHQGLIYEGLCQISALQNHFQMKPLNKAPTKLCWATMGVEIDSSLKFDHHLNNIVTRAYQRINLLFRGYVTKDVVFF